MLLLEDSWQNHRIHNALKGKSQRLCSLTAITCQPQLWVRIPPWVSSVKVIQLACRSVVLSGCTNNVRRGTRDQHLPPPLILHSRYTLAIGAECGLHTLYARPLYFIPRWKLLTCNSLLLCTLLSYKRTKYHTAFKMYLDQMCDLQFGHPWNRVNCNCNFFGKNRCQTL